MADTLVNEYKRDWKAFKTWALDSSPKMCSDFDLGREFGDELRRLMSTTISEAALQTAFTWAWRSCIAVHQSTKDWDGHG